jgi:hypothetical protein
MIPQGALFTLAVRTDRIRTTPHARLVRRLFAGIRDWREMLGGTTLDVLDNLDQLVLSAANPFGANGEAADWFVLAKPAAGSERALARTIEAMVQSEHPARTARTARSGARTSAHSSAHSSAASTGASGHSDSGVQDEPQPPSGQLAGAGSAEPPEHLQANVIAGPHAAQPSVAARGQDGAVSSQVILATSDAADAGVDEREPEPSPWRAQQGAQVVQLNRYGAVRDYVIFPDGTAAIAMPSQLDALLTAMSQRSESVAESSSPVALLGQAEGIRNLIVEVPTMHGPFPLPSRAELTLQLVPAEDGAVELSAKLQYDDVAQARYARDEWVYCRTRWHAMIQTIPGLGTVNALTGMFGVRTWTSDVPIAEGALDVLEFRAHRNTVVVRGRLSAEQVRAVLNVAVNAAGMAR